MRVVLIRGLPWAAGRPALTCCAVTLFMTPNVVLFCRKSHDTVTLAAPVMQISSFLCDLCFPYCFLDLGESFLCMHGMSAPPCMSEVAVRLCDAPSF